MMNARTLWRAGGVYGAGGACGRWRVLPASRRLARMSLPVRIMVVKAGQPPWTMEARQNERPRWRPDDAAGAAGRDTRAGHGAESRRDPGRRAEGPGGRPRRTGRGAAGDPRRGERVPRAL